MAGKFAPNGISILCLAAAWSLLPASQAQAQTTSLDWLAGRWCMSTTTGYIEEVWLPEVGNQLLGISRTVKNGKVVAFEFMRIESVTGTTQFIAQPGGAPATVFTASHVTENRLELENPEHDFPQKIVYQREADALTATISGPGDGGQEQSIRYAYQACIPDPDGSKING
jgi:hypothetical protein